MRKFGITDIEQLTLLLSGKVDLPTAPAQDLKLKNSPPDAFDATRRDRCGEDSHRADLYKMDDDVSCVDFFTLYERKAAGHIYF
jgi:hypothetical protein